MKRFITSAPRHEEEEKVKEKEKPEGSRYQQLRIKPPTRIIHVIARGPAGGGTSQLGRKRYARSVNLVIIKSLEFKCTNPITLIENDIEEVNFPHYDALIIKANFRQW